MPPSAACAAPGGARGGAVALAARAAAEACAASRSGDAASPSHADAQAERFLSHEALAREPHSLRALAPLLAEPGIIWLAGGTPPASSFPFASFSATLKDGRVIEMSAEEAYECQQYCMNSAGYPPLVAWVRGHVAALHAPPREVEHLVTCGNTNAIDLVLRSLLNRGDVALAEEFTYSATLQAMRPLGVTVLGVPSDDEGPRPDALRALLESRAAAGLPPPKLLYGIPVSCNPTGVSWSEERKAAIYSLACEFDFLILEDDAYYYLQFPPSNAATNGASNVTSAEPPGLLGLGRSLLARDVAGRVIRADTFSKFLAPGLRTGWLTAPPAVAERLLRCMQATAQGANSHAQVLAARLLAAWGDAGLHAHAAALQAEYARRAAALMGAAQRHLGGTADVAPLATWAPPRAGMFLWMRLGCGVVDSEELQPFLKEFKVVVVPGKFFHVDGAPSPYVRLSFASASDADFDAGMARLASLLRSLPGAPPTPERAQEGPGAAKAEMSTDEDGC